MFLLILNRRMDMLDIISVFIRKNALTIILAFFPPILIWFFLQKESSDLSVSVTSETSVISLNADYSSDISVFYKKQPIAALFVADIRIKNEGDRPIEQSDFNKPITIQFNGEVVAPVKVISTIPEGLPVKINASGNSIEVEPLLMNPDDFFNIQAKVIDPTKNGLEIKTTARIKSIKNISFNPLEKDKNPWYQFALGFISSILAFISILSGKSLFRKVTLIAIKLPGITLELTKEIESSHQISQRVEEMAKKLAISGHDFKSNILFLRLKIEGLLRELASTNELKYSSVGSIRMLSNELVRYGLIDRKVISLINDITPAMNRELHESETYLTSDEFEVLQHAALSIIAALEERLEKSKHKKC
jgi:hypothetical protein